MAGCPCGSGQPFEACCEPFIAGRALPPTAEALMRSRYSAFTVKAIDYLYESRVADQRPGVNRSMLEKWANAVQWQELEIHSIEGDGPGEAAAMMEFSAHFRMEGRKLVHREVATFRREGERWYYVNGRPVAAAPGPEPVRVMAAAGRNDPCPCGSGRKFKKCCAAA